MNNGIRASVELTTNGLSTEILGDIFSTMQNKADPSHKPWFEKAAGLFTATERGHPAAHSDVVLVTGKILQERRTKSKR